MLVIYDTSNFVDYPIGGQLTSIKNFLKYVAEYRSDCFPDILLVGVTLNEDEVGVLKKLNFEGLTCSFLPVASVSGNQNAVKGSLRLAYVKGLLKHLPKVRKMRNIINYIHTPEAYLPVRLITGKNAYVFSHGSFLNMKDNLRFYKGSLIASAFQLYLHQVIKRASGIFTLDAATFRQYEEMGATAYLVRNSIVMHSQKSERKINPNAIKVLYVGRLSAVKNIGPIIDACEDEERIISLRIAGAGEEYSTLLPMAKAKTFFLGALCQADVEKEMRAADILVMNSVHEGVPMTVLEAMSLALPVVSTDVGGISEVVQFGKGGLRSDGSARSIRECILAIVPEYHLFSMRAYELASEFSYEKVNSEIFDILFREVN